VNDDDDDDEFEDEKWLRVRSVREVIVKM